MNAADQYLDSLKILVEKATNNSDSPKIRKELLSTIRNTPQEIVVTKRHKESGAYFTNFKLAQRLVSPWAKTLRNGKVKVLDPSCGAGDLLLAIASQLPIKRNLTETIAYWQKCIYGCDIHPVFTQITKLRLITLALSRGTRADKLPDIARVFTGIICQDFTNYSDLKKMSHIILNPPFTHSLINEKCSWGTGLISQAGLFLDRALTQSSRNAEIAAILPDVLRTGARYRLWREKVESLSKIKRINIIGSFGSADIDVFTIHLTKRKEQSSTVKSWYPKIRANNIGNCFTVHIGAVVPHRDPELGKEVPFFDARSVPPWKIITKTLKKRRFKGTLHTPPFVLVRRTSSPNDLFRAKASVINYKIPVAIENHLLVLSPNDNTLKSCVDLMKYLKSDSVSHWLNKRIRCRHLTVDSLKTIPYLGEL